MLKIEGYPEASGAVSTGQSNVLKNSEKPTFQIGKMPKFNNKKQFYSDTVLAIFAIKH
jgi:hypothetical protein